MNVIIIIYFIYLFYFICFITKNCERVTTTAGGHLLWTLGTAIAQRPDQHTGNSTPYSLR